jgi:phosphomannomutase
MAGTSGCPVNLNSGEEAMKPTEDRYGKIFGAYDIRGVVGEDLDTPTVAGIARAYGDYICPRGPGHFVIGHDDRWSSAAFAEAASVGLRQSGHKVTHMGLSSTPMVYWYGAEGGFDGSITISASHLPPEHNGLKLCARDALPLSDERGLPEIQAILRKPPKTSTRACSEIVRYASPMLEYAAQIRGHLRPGRPLRIAVDAGNGMGGMETEAVLGISDTIDLWRLNFHPDSKFPVRPSNPLEPGALDQLSTIVTKNKLDFGVAFDGDADRAVAVDELGRMVPPDALGGLIALYLLEKNPGSNILHDLRVSRVLPELIEVGGGRPVRSRVGHAFIKRAMRENKAVFAMELSGHYYYADLHYTDNAQRTLVELINIVSVKNAPLSKLIKPFQRYPTSGEINLEVKDRDAVLKAIEKHYADGNTDHLDGLSVDYPDWWFNVRPSHTEPILRLNLGALGRDLLDRKRQELLSQIKSLDNAKQDRQSAKRALPSGERNTGR